MKTSTLTSHIELIGDPLENFYQLGLKDKSSSQDVYSALHNLFSINNKFLNENIKKILQEILAVSIKRNIMYKSYFDTYCEGLSLSSDEVFYNLILPEILSCLKKWLPLLNIPLIPHIPSIACSSLFAFNTFSKSPFHLRILDFPLGFIADKNLRTINYKLTGFKKIFAHSISGIPFPSLTSMNEDGLTIAIHQKYTDKFEIKGSPIFELAFLIISTCKNVHEALKVLQKNISYTTWGLYLLDAKNNALAVEISGKDLCYKKFKIESKKDIFYFNNIPNQKFQKGNSLPVGMQEFNTIRHQQADLIIQKINNKKTFSEIDALKYFGQNLNSKIQTITPNTPASIQILTMNPRDLSSHEILGNSPKVYINSIFKYNNLFNYNSSEELYQAGKIFNFKMTNRTANINNYNKMMSLAMKAQLYFDSHDLNNAFHFLQMATNITEDKASPESYIIQFYYHHYLFLYIPEQYLLQEYLQNDKNRKYLPLNLQAHFLFLKNRYQRYFNIQSDITINDFRRIKCKEFYLKLFEFEQKLNIKMLHLILKQTSKARLEIFDIIYPHFFSD